MDVKSRAEIHGGGLAEVQKTERCSEMCAWEVAAFGNMSL